MTHKIIFLHGFFASGECTPAKALKEYFNNKATVIAPDLPLHPTEAIRYINVLCDKERPDLLIGNSNGSFLAQIVASARKLPALLGNPYFEMTKFLSERIGQHEYKSPRADGNQKFVINQNLIDEFAELQDHQWDYCPTADRDLIWGLFGDNDTLAHYEPSYLKHYGHAFHFPGAHTPTADEVKEYYAPLAEKLIEAAESKHK